MKRLSRVTPAPPEAWLTQTPPFFVSFSVFIDATSKRYNNLLYSTNFAVEILSVCPGLPNFT